MAANRKPEGTTTETPKTGSTTHTVCSCGGKLMGSKLWHDGPEPGEVHRVKRCSVCHAIDRSDRFELW